ncbi:Reticulocyte-binding protein 2 like a [Dissostichus eleginoides]|uniref:Reticulocyte-binding protein 2 like a n=1 Tax=Dissostichus eleginoides TaxID=100907 RepID=A0AAD9BQ30_DISEL|nr:Reticulocyte-binding protein 2 like a [Dissostichus eleginoides]
MEPLSPVPRKRARRSRGGMAEFLTESEMDLLVEQDDKSGSTALGDLQRMAEFTYKLTEEDIRRLIELRSSNESLFTGRRNTAKPDLKFPPRGMEGQTPPASWPWFSLMGDALEGRLAGKAAGECLLEGRGSVSELESMGGGDAAEADGNVTYIDASGEECSTPSENSYKMTDQDTRKMIRLRAANEALFTGRRNAAKAAWKAIIREIGLQGKVSTYQMAKKWDNLKRRYKDLKYPPVGMENMSDSASSWPWFQLMNDAMEGRLTSSAPLLTPVTHDDDDHPSPKHRPRSSLPLPPPLPQSSTDFVDDAFGGDDGGDSGANEAQLGGLEREWEMVEREREALEREREMVERERATVERERATVERERATVQTERLWLERERETLGREREALDQRALMMNSVGHSGHLNALM